MRGLLAPQNTFLDTIATRFDGTRKSPTNQSDAGCSCLVSFLGGLTSENYFTCLY